MTPRVLLLVVTLCLGCGAGCPWQSQNPARLEFGGVIEWAYPSGVSGRESVVHWRGSDHAARAEVAGKAVPLNVRKQADGVGLGKVSIPSELVGGFHPLTLLGEGNARTTSSIPVAPEGFFGWAQQGGGYVDECRVIGDRAGGEAAVRRICVQGGVGQREITVILQNHWPTPSAPSATYTWRRFDLAAEGWVRTVNLLAYDPSGERHVLFVGSMTSTGTHLYRGYPLDWTTTNVSLERVTEPRGMLGGQFNGLKVWRGPGGTRRLVGLEWDVLSSWEIGPGTDDLSDAVAMTPLENPAIDMVMHDLDGDGVDEMMFTALREGGIAVYRGSPAGAMVEVAKTWDGSVPGGECHQQRNPSVTDLDKDGFLDIVIAHGGAAAMDVLWGAPDGSLQPQRFDRGVPAVAEYLEYEHKDPDCIVTTIASCAWLERCQVLALWPLAGAVFYVFQGREITHEESWNARMLPHDDAFTGTFEVVDADGDGYADLMATRGMERIIYWRRPAFEAEDGLAGPRDLTQYDPDGGIAYQKYTEEY